MLCKGTKNNALDMKSYTISATVSCIKQLLKMQEEILFKIIGFCIIAKKRINEKPIMFLKYSASYGICCESYHMRASKKVAVLVCFINCLHTRQKCFLMKCKTNLGPIFHNINSTFIPSPDILRFKQLGRFYVLSFINNYF